MNTSDDLLWPILFGGILGTLIFCWILRAFLSVKKRITLQEIQIKLLLKIAEQQGVDKNELEVIKSLTDQA